MYLSRAMTRFRLASCESRDNLHEPPVKHQSCLCNAVILAAVFHIFISKWLGSKSSHEHFMFVSVKAAAHADEFIHEDLSKQVYRIEFVAEANQNNTASAAWPEL